MDDKYCKCTFEKVIKRSKCKKKCLRSDHSDLQSMY